MARQGRYFVAGQVLHVIQRGNNRQAIFFDEADYGQYREWLTQAAREHGCAVHAYVLMTNHVHLLVTPRAADSLPGMMQSLGRRYVRLINRRYRRSGTLWEGRYRAAPLDSDAYFFSCCRYIELNPVRARMVAHPRDYRFSSYPANALGEDDALVTRHAVFDRLGADPQAQQKAYRDLFRSALDENFVAALRDATNGGWALGDERFRQQIEEAASRRAAPLPKGRRVQPQKDKRQLNLL